MVVFKKHFTLEEARRLLPWVRQLIGRIQHCMAALERKGFKLLGATPVSLELHEIGFSKNGEGSHSLPQEYLELLASLQALGAAGVHIKNASAGLVDFPAFTPEGEEVFLCYLEGEPDIVYWHRLEDGFQGRRPVEGTFLQDGSRGGAGSA
ncbi:MAG TPA: DUF2203 domain-containing protein [bacterium]|nr:DUF2203 domain-containing protein [bacterium]